MIRALPSIFLPRRRLLQLGLGQRSFQPQASPRYRRPTSRVTSRTRTYFSLRSTSNTWKLSTICVARQGKGIDDSDAGSDAGR